MKTTFEIGLMEETKHEWLANKIIELEAKLNTGDINESKFNSFL